MALIHGNLTKQILACFYQVHSEMGSGWPEHVYSRAMDIALTDAGLRVDREVLIAVYFRGRTVGEFRADAVVDSRVVLEYKTATKAVEVAEAQLLNYLRCTNLEVGLLLKFFAKPLFRRLLYTNDRKEERGGPSRSVTIRVPRA